MQEFATWKYHDVLSKFTFRGTEESERAIYFSQLLPLNSWAVDMSPWQLLNETYLLSAPAGEGVMSPFGTRTEY
jgi:hypothetical protein